MSFTNNEVAGLKVTDEQKAEVKVLYGKLARHWKWPMPETWLGDRAAVVGDIDHALTCMRSLVVEQGL